MVAWRYESYLLVKVNFVSPCGHVISSRMIYFTFNQNVSSTLIPPHIFTKISVCRQCVLVEL